MGQLGGVAPAFATAPEPTSAVERHTASRALDLAVSGMLLLVMAPIIAAVAAAIVVESFGSPLFRCRRVGVDGREFDMLKFRKMHPRAEGPALTVTDDDRFTRVGWFLAKTKLDEIPQLWNVLRGEMSLVGPRPQDARFVALSPELHRRILSVRPGITGLAQLAYAREPEILDPTDRVGDYVRRILPATMYLDVLYVDRQSLLLDLQILWWTATAVALRRDVAVNRSTCALSMRRRPEASQPDVVTLGAP